MFDNQDILKLTATRLNWIEKNYPDHYEKERKEVLKIIGGLPGRLNQLQLKHRFCLPIAGASEVWHRQFTKVDVK